MITQFLFRPRMKRGTAASLALAIQQGQKVWTVMGGLIASGCRFDARRVGKVNMGEDDEILCQ